MWRQTKHDISFIKAELLEELAVLSDCTIQFPAFMHAEWNPIVRLLQAAVLLVIFYTIFSLLQAQSSDSWR